MLVDNLENAQNYLRDAQAAFKDGGCDLVQILQTKGLTVREAVDEANDLLTAHPDIKAIYGMYDEAATGAAKVLQIWGSSARWRSSPPTEARRPSSCCATAW